MSVEWYTNLQKELLFFGVWFVIFWCRLIIFGRIGAGNGDVLGDFAFILKGFEAFFKFGEGDFDGDEVDFGVGLFDEFDKIITVAVH